MRVTPTDHSQMPPAIQAPGLATQYGDAAGLQRASALISTTPDFPAPGVLFRDVTPLLADPRVYREVLDAMAEPFCADDGAPGFDLVAGIEARGFVMAGGLAAASGTGVLPIRKAGKLPNPQVTVEYGLEYAEAAVESSGDLTGARVLLVDDVLATGGTLRAAHTVVERLGGTVVGSAVILELEELKGRTIVPACHTVFTV
ncbi:Adenine phosphoribosyltransferase [Brevibacterium yomogidense]|uniref:Adenine phosphoribosyltransferase n=2 Tax=Brevibacterium yomogidense TaxID=946573 RepID=A0A1X6WYQ8_9MICO|nr:Adenine phosphoribosyltransferase [Brevibacterium yomogidense]